MTRRAVDWAFCSKPAESFEERLSLDTVMQRVRKIAEMPIGRWLKIAASGSFTPLRWAMMEWAVSCFEGNHEEQ